MTSGNMLYYIIYIYIYMFIRTQMQIQMVHVKKKTMEAYRDGKEREKKEIEKKRQTVLS